MSTPAQADRIDRLSPAKRALLEKWRRGQSAGVASPVAVPRRCGHGPAPLSFAQQRLWFLDQLEPSNPFYNIAAALRLRGSLDVAAFERAFQAVIARHEVLRTTFTNLGGEPRQKVAESIAWRLGSVDLSGLAHADRETRLQSLAIEESLRPFDLSLGPLLRGTLVRLAADEHVLLATMHHIVCDGWSMGVLKQETAEAYAAEIERRPPRLDPLPIQYLDYSVWQREELSGDRLADLLDYWESRFGEPPPPLQLPLDFPRPAVQTFRGDVRRLWLSRELVDRLRAFAREERATLFMTLLAAWYSLLARYSGQADLCVGTPIAGRTRPELERLIGFFVNTLALRCDLSDDPPFRELLARVRETTLGAYARQDLPFERLVEAVAPERDLARTPLFQTMFVLQNIPLRSQQIAGLETVDVSFDHAPVSNFDLTLNADEHTDRVDLSLVFNPDLFAGDTIERMLSAYETLLAGALDEPDARVSRLPLLDADERRWHVVDCNATARKFDDETCVHDLVSTWAERTPHAAAVVFDNVSLSYGELERRTNQLARRLHGLGVGRETTVGVCLERSIEQIVALLAVLKAGGAYLPLDPSYPDERLAYMLDDSGAELCIAAGDVRARLAASGRTTRFLSLEDDARAIAAESDAPLEPLATADSLAYVIYTSGSTGQPKGVEVRRRGLANHARALVELYRLAPGDRVLQFLGISFDAAAEEIFPALASGAALCLHRRPQELAGRELVEWSRSHGVNVLHIPPPVWASLLAEIELAGPTAAEHLKTVMSGGDSIRRELLERWRAAVGDRVRFVYVYGVSEATITTTAFDGRNAMVPSASGRLPIGRPIANNRAYVLDESLMPAPIGVPGELYIGGVGVARGYRGRPELSAARFVRDPFDPSPAARLYRTGDLARRLSDGAIEFLGRVDQQVKIRGYRIELGEVEAALRGHPQVAEAAAVALADEHGEKRLAVYAGAPAEPLPSAEELRGFLAERLPPHMLPSSVVVVNRLPRLEGHKLDINGLPPPAWGASTARARRYEPPRNELEQRLAELWAGVLRVERVGTHDNFFELGGDSIQSIQLVSRAAAVGLRFTPKQLFQHQSIAELAAVVDQAPPIDAEQGPVVGPAPLTPIQREFFALAPPAPAHFNQSVLLEAAAELPAASIAAAVEALVAHHDALRNRFEQRDGEWRQVGTGVENASPLLRVDLSHIDDAELDAAIERQANAAQSSLDLAAGPLCRFVLFDCGGERPARLLAVVHHLVVDGVSWRILLDDLASAVVQHQRTGSIALPPKTTSLRLWSERLPEYVASGDLDAELAFWREQTASAEQLVAADFDRGPNTSASDAAVCLRLSPEETHALLHAAQQPYHTRGAELLVAALVRTLAETSSAERLRIDLEGHGREALFDDVDLSRTVGWFTSLHPLALRPPRDDGAAAWIISVKEQLRAVPRGGVGHGLLRWLGDDACRRELAASPRPDVSFNYLGQFDQTFAVDAPLRPVTGPTGKNRADATPRPHLWEVIAAVSGGALSIEWHYSANRHRRATVERVASRFLELLRDTIAHCLDPSAGAATPADFPLAAVDQDDLDELSALLGDD